MQCAIRAGGLLALARSTLVTDKHCHTLTNRSAPANKAIKPARRTVHGLSHREVEHSAFLEITQQRKTQAWLFHNSGTAPSTPKSLVLFLHEGKVYHHANLQA
ncbi:hypothetical protein PoB_002693300 [Plakobranchus ocellatus]|uniref:Secreted protein n=1 Tax=Plakobranchus ocellatus TaxID=259542 RepID=A0AAV3ZZW1_9GAST|nr:hypothetical protein PoB_002693300 [Plakobranchus ocellatus]